MPNCTKDKNKLQHIQDILREGVVCTLYMWQVFFAGCRLWVETTSSFELKLNKSQYKTQPQVTSANLV